MVLFTRFHKETLNLKKRMNMSDKFDVFCSPRYLSVPEGYMDG